MPSRNNRSNSLNFFFFNYRLDISSGYLWLDVLVGQPGGNNHVCMEHGNLRTLDTADVTSSTQTVCQSSITTEK